MKKKSTYLHTWRKSFCFINLFLIVASMQFRANASEYIKVGNTTRNMIVYVPQDLPEDRPLIISMHGMNQDAAYQQREAKWELVADTAKFAVVYPNGNNNSWDIWGDSDIDFILAIIDNMHERYSIDRSRVYLSGFSMGGMMTYHAANKIADKIAAFAPVAGYPIGGGDCNSSRPVPIIHIHGDDDPVVGYGGVEPYLSGWIKRNNCPATPIITNPYPANKPGSTASKKYWGLGLNATEVVLLTLGGKGHWYSMDPASVYTSVEIWNFAKRFSLQYEEEESHEGYVTATYDFTNDEAATAASIPPAEDITIASGNTAKAGVVSYTDANGETGNMFKPYGFGQKRNTGVVDLNKFSSTATNYTVTWKQCVGGSSKIDTKAGVLLRGDASKVGDATNGYVQGIMEGYLFVAHFNRTSGVTEFRIYKSTMEDGLVVLANQSVGSLNPAIGQPVWFRAKVTGESIATLIFEYSTDNEMWYGGAVHFDYDVSFKEGSTQLVWGLASTNLNIYIDDITFYGNPNDGGASAIVPILPESNLIVVEQEYYSLTGQRVLSLENTLSKGIYIVKSIMSDGTVKTKKVCLK